MKSVASLPAGGNGVPIEGYSPGLHFMGGVPTLLRHHVHDDLRAVVSSRTDLRWSFPMGQGGPEPMKKLRYINNINDFPDMLVSAEYGNVFNRDFHERYVGRGAFSSCQPQGSQHFLSDLIDPKGWIGVYALAPFLMLVDRQRLNGLPVPRSWAALLDPMYRGQLVLGGWRRSGETRFRQFNKFLLLHIAKEFGLSGVARLLLNVRGILHSMQMPRLAGTDSSPGGIYVLPWSVAEMCPRRAETEVVWPADGALAYPLWLTVKTERRSVVEPLVRYFYGRGLGDYLNRNGYPSACPDCPTTIPQGTVLRWLGWDFIRHRSTADLVKAVSASFAEALDGRADIGAPSCV